jgi:hypothetical protein
MQNHVRDVLVPAPIRWSRQLCSGWRRQAWTRTVWATSLVAALLVGQPLAPAMADGTTWTPIEVEPNAWRSVAYGNGLWVAVAESGTDRVMTSPDGISWTARAAAEASAWRSVAYGNGLWVAVANTGTNRVMTSEDPTCTLAGGATSCWTASAALNGRQWRSVAYGNGLWVAVADVGTDTDRVVTSPDGLNWTVSSTGDEPEDRREWTGVAFGGGVWVVSDRRLAAKVITSSNPACSTAPCWTVVDPNWTAVASSPTDRRLTRSVAFGDGVWFGVGRAALRSTDSGVTWTGSEFGTTPDWASVAYGNGVWVAVADGGTSRVLRSADAAITWTGVDVGDGLAGNAWQSVAYGDGVWVAVASSGTNLVMRSVDPVPALVPAPVPPAVACDSLSPAVGAAITCTVTGGDPGIDILWRAAYNPVFAEAGVTLGADGTGEFSFVVPAAALGEELTVELVEWLAPLSLGVVGGPVPGSVPAGEGPVPLWPICLAALAGVALMRRGMLVKG